MCDRGKTQKHRKPIIKQRVLRALNQSSVPYHKILSDGLQLRASVDVVHASLCPLLQNVLHRIFEDSLGANSRRVWRLGIRSRQ